MKKNICLFNVCTDIFYFFILLLRNIITYIHLDILIIGDIEYERNNSGNEENSRATHHNNRQCQYNRLRHGLGKHGGDILGRDKFLPRQVLIGQHISLGIAEDERIYEERV